MKTKTLLPVLIAAFIATTLALFTSGCGEKLTVEKELTVEEIIEQIQQKEGNIKDYSCIIHLNLFFEGENLEREFEVMSKNPGMYRILTKKPGKDTEKVEISDGKYMWAYYPWKNTTIKVKLPETSGSEEKESAEKESGEKSDTGFIEDLLNKSGVSLLGTEEIDGRPAYLLVKNSDENGWEEREEDKEEGGEEEVEGEGGPLSGYREKFWIDEETGTLLRYETYDSSENLTVKYEIRDLKINTGISDSEFEFEVPEGVTVETREFGKSDPPENLTGPDGDEQIALDFIMDLCP